MPSDETRDILCQDGCGEVCGTITFPVGTPEDKWAQAMGGYYKDGCPNVDSRPAPEPTLEEKIDQVAQDQVALASQVSIATGVPIAVGPALEASSEEVRP